MTEDVIRSLLVAHYKLGVEEVLIVNHTGCGMQTFRDEELREDLRRRCGTDAAAPEQFHAFGDMEDHVRRQIQRIKSHPWMPSRIPVSGGIYDVHTGKLNVVETDASGTRSFS